MSQNKTSFPLYWPDGWPRVPKASRHNSHFGAGHFHKPSMAKARDFLQAELTRLRALDPVLSTNVKLRLDGMPMSNLTQPDDCGAAVFFDLKGKGVSLACDKWNRVECNVMAIAKHIESLRAQMRWGVGNVEQAFRGYMALPGVGQTSGDNPWQILGISINADEKQLREAYRLLVGKFHPDNKSTGDSERFLRIQRAYEMIAQNLRTQHQRPSTKVV